MLEFMRVNLRGYLIQFIQRKILWMNNPGKLRYGCYHTACISSTSKFEDNYCAATVTWVSQASFEPPLISVCIKGDSASYTVVKERGEFMLHLLGEDQKDLAASFFKPSILENELINGQKYQLQDDLPLLTAVPVYIKCRVLDILEKGDHPLFLAEVIDAVVNEESKPLELSKTDWSYGG